MVGLPSWTFHTSIWIATTCFEFGVSKDGWLGCVGLVYVDVVGHTMDSRLCLMSVSCVVLFVAGLGQS